MGRWVSLLVCWATVASTCGAATFEEIARQAAAARDADQVPQAINLYQQALGLKPDWPEGWFYLGTLYYDIDRYAEALPAFRRFVGLGDKPAGWAFVGLCEFETGDYAQAREHLQKALDGGVAPEIEPAVRFHEALALTRLGLFGQAMHWYRAMVRSRNHDATLMAGLGLTALNRAMLPKEEPTDQRELVAAAGQTVYTWMSGDHAKTEASFRTLLELYGTAPGVHYLYATYLLSGHADAAMTEARRELEVNPECGEARALVALLLRQAGQGAEAAAEAKKAVAEQPSSPLAQYTYALGAGDAHEAAAHLEIAERLNPFNLEYHLLLAHEYALLGRNEEALRERRAAIQLAKENDSQRPY